MKELPENGCFLDHSIFTHLTRLNDKLATPTTPQAADRAEVYWRVRQFFSTCWYACRNAGKRDQ